MSESVTAIEQSLREAGVIAADAPASASADHDRPWFIALLQGFAGWLAGMAMGAIFAWILGDRADRIGGGLAWGLLYGLFWWVLGTLILMPLLLGMAAFSPLTMAGMRTGAMWSLAAYLLSGPILGGVFAGLHRGDGSPPGPARRA